MSNFNFKDHDKICLPGWPDYRYVEVLYVGEKRFFCKSETGAETSQPKIDRWSLYVAPPKIGDRVRVNWPTEKQHGCYGTVVKPEFEKTHYIYVLLDGDGFPGLYKASELVPTPGVAVFPFKKGDLIVNENCVTTQHYEVVDPCPTDPENFDGIFHGISVVHHRGPARKDREWSRYTPPAPIPTRTLQVGDTVRISAPNTWGHGQVGTLEKNDLVNSQYPWKVRFSGRTFPALTKELTLVVPAPVQTWPVGTILRYIPVGFTNATAIVQYVGPSDRPKSFTGKLVSTGFTSDYWSLDTTAGKWEVVK